MNYRRETKSIDSFFFFWLRSHIADSASYISAHKKFSSIFDLIKIIISHPIWERFTNIYSDMYIQQRHLQSQSLSKLLRFIADFIICYASPWNRFSYVQKLFRNCQKCTRDFVWHNYSLAFCRKSTWFTYQKCTVNMENVYLHQNDNCFSVVVAGWKSFECHSHKICMQFTYLKQLIAVPYPYEIFCNGKKVHSLTHTKSPFTLCVTHNGNLPVFVVAVLPNFINAMNTVFRHSHIKWKPMLATHMENNVNEVTCSL